MSRTPRATASLHRQRPRLDEVLAAGLRAHRPRVAPVGALGPHQLQQAIEQVDEDPEWYKRSSNWPEDYRKSTELNVHVMNKDGRMLWFAPDEAKKDKDVVTAALDQNPDVFAYADPGLIAELTETEVSKEGFKQFKPAQQEWFLKRVAHDWRIVESYPYDRPEFHWIWGNRAIVRAILKSYLEQNPKQDMSREDWTLENSGNDRFEPWSPYDRAFGPAAEEAALIRMPKPSHDGPAPAALPISGALPPVLSRPRPARGDEEGDEEQHADAMNAEDQEEEEAEGNWVSPMPAWWYEVPRWRAIDEMATDVSATLAAFKQAMERIVQELLADESTEVAIGAYHYSAQQLRKFAQGWIVLDGAIQTMDEFRAFADVRQRIAQMIDQHNDTMNVMAEYNALLGQEPFYWSPWVRDWAKIELSLYGEPDDPLQDYAPRVNTARIASFERAIERLGKQRRDMKIGRLRIMDRAAKAIFGEPAERRD